MKPQDGTELSKNNLPDDPWIETYTGGKFHIAKPRPEEVRLTDIAHALSMQCRFTGHCDRFYSVAEHSIWVARMCPKPFGIIGLLHDASEAYVVDLNRPTKQYGDMGRLYRQIEGPITAAIFEAFHLPVPVDNHFPEFVHEADNAILNFEHETMLKGAPWETDPERVAANQKLIAASGARIIGLGPTEGERLFKESFFDFMQEYRTQV